MGVIRLYKTVYVAKLVKCSIKILCWQFTSHHYTKVKRQTALILQFPKRANTWDLNLEPTAIPLIAGSLLATTRGTAAASALPSTLCRLLSLSWSLRKSPGSYSPWGPDDVVVENTNLMHLPATLLAVNKTRRQRSALSHAELHSGPECCAHTLSPWRLQDSSAFTCLLTDSAIFETRISRMCSTGRADFLPFFVPMPHSSLLLTSFVTRNESLLLKTAMTKAYLTGHIFKTSACSRRLQMPKRTSTAENNAVSVTSSCSSPRTGNVCSESVARVGNDGLCSRKHCRGWDSPHRLPSSQLLHGSPGPYLLT